MPPVNPMGGADPSDVEKNKIFAILAYLGILVLVPILAARQSPFARYHANQGLLLFLASLVLYFGGAIVWVMATFVVHFLACLGMCVWPVVGIAVIVYAVIGIINAANGKMKPLPGFPEITLIK